MLPYISKWIIRCLKYGIYAGIAITVLLFFRRPEADIAVARFPPQKISDYVCSWDSRLDIQQRHFKKFSPRHTTNSTEQRILVLLEGSYSRHGKLLLQILNASKFPYKVEVFSKNLPLLTTATHGRYSIIIIESYYKYINLARWNRQLLDKYLVEYDVPLISFLSSKSSDLFERVRIKDSDLHFWQNQEVTSLNVVTSPVHHLAKIGSSRDVNENGWVLFEVSEGYETVLSALDVKGHRRAAVLRDSGQRINQKNGRVDKIERILFGHNITDWMVKMTFIDALWYCSGGKIGSSLERFIQVDIDDIFVGARGTRMAEDDVRELVQSQHRLRRWISNFTYTLGFSGSYFRRGDDIEDKADELLIELASNFVWFPHMWRHNHAHEHNFTYLQAAMTQNKLFAKNMRLPVPYQYAIAPQHDGVYPVHEDLYDAWKEVWGVLVTATEEYPHFKPATNRMGFVHKDIMVLPRQTCGLFTHTQFFHNYPDGFHKLISLIEGGDLFATILLNQISVFMTHQQNYAHDRLAVYTFENLARFVSCFTNIELRWTDPLTSAKKYFVDNPTEKTPMWNNPCTDPRHKAILPPHLNCSNLTLPNILIVGPQKTGSTALGSFLTLHPNVSTNLPIPDSFEELQFFGGAHYHKGVTWYSKQFRPALGVFEKSATYFDNPAAPRQAFSLVPDAKIVVILYDPAIRAYSWFQHQLAHKDSAAISAGTMDAVLNSTDLAIKKLKHRCLSGGRYTHHLDRYAELFPANQLYLVDGSRLKTEPIEVMTELTLRLGLPSFDYTKVIRFSPSKGFFCQVIDSRVTCLGGGKGRKYEPMSFDLKTKLNQIFLKDNSALHKYLIKNKLPVPKWLVEVLS